ncbi:MAG: hypothetical protein ACLFTT_08520 [Candidatus Hydrogenedentota bacterium]
MMRNTTGVLMLVALGAWCALPAVAGTADVADALAETPSLVRHHRGYVGYLREHPDLGAVETQYWALMQNTGFREVAGQFHEALMRDAEMRRLFDVFYDRLAEDGNLVRAWTAFWEAQTAVWGDSAQNQPGLAQIQADPMGLLSLLEGGGEDDADENNDALAPLLRTLRQRPELAAMLRGSYRDLLGMPGAAESVAPWWQQVAAFDARSGGAYGRMAAHFLAHGRHFQRWHRRNLRLAEKPQARDWIRWWQARLNLADVSLADYGAYLVRLMREEGAAAAAEARWRARFGAAPPWPPASGTPPWPGVQRPDPDDKPQTVRAPAAPKDSAATVRRPSMPSTAMPQMPGKPGHQGKPPLRTHDNTRRGKSRATP